MPTTTRMQPIMDIRPLIEMVGLEQFIKQVGMERIIEQGGKEWIDDKKSLEWIAAHLSPERREELKRLLS